MDLQLSGIAVFRLANYAVVKTDSQWLKRKIRKLFYIRPAVGARFLSSSLDLMRSGCHEMKFLWVGICLAIGKDVTGFMRRWGAAGGAACRDEMGRGAGRLQHGFTLGRGFAVRGWSCGKILKLIDVRPRVIVFSAYPMDICP